MCVFRELCSHITCSETTESFMELNFFILIYCVFHHPPVSNLRLAQPSMSLTVIRLTISISGFVMDLDPILIVSLRLLLLLFCSWIFCTHFNNLNVCILWLFSSACSAKSDLLISQFCMYLMCSLNQIPKFILVWHIQLFSQFSNLIW